MPFSLPPSDQLLSRFGQGISYSDCAHDRFSGPFLNGDRNHDRRIMTWEPMNGKVRWSRVLTRTTASHVRSCRKVPMVSGPLSPIYTYINTGRDCSLRRPTAVNGDRGAGNRLSFIAAKKYGHGMIMSGWWRCCGER